MTEEKRKAYALMRYGIIAPVICHTLPEGVTTKEFFEEAAKQTYRDPDGVDRKYSAPTLERWYYAYRNHGFDKLLPESRSDCGQSRKIDDEIAEAIKYMKSQHPRMPATEIYKTLVNNGTIINGDISLSTLTRCVKRISEKEEFPVGNEMRRYERPHINEVWCGDSCVGPKIIQDGTKKRIYIMALIDDSSRFITGAVATYNDNFLSLMGLIKTSTLKYGVPKMFCFDNGRSYRNNQMDLLAARMGTSIHFCHPYTPIQKAKIERWFRTLRDKWMSTVDFSSFKTIEQIQKSLDEYVLSYNRTVHSSLNESSPEERFFSESEYIRRLNPDNCDKIFLLEIERKVSVDCVISIDNIEYEVNSKYAGKRIKLRYSPDMSAIYVVEDQDTLTPVRLLNKKENADVKRNKFYLSGGDNS